VCFFRRREIPKVDFATALHDPRTPSSTASADTLIPRRVVGAGSGICSILTAGCDTKIFPAIVLGHHVDVIDVAVGPFACLIKPRKAVSAICKTVYVDRPITAQHASARNISNANTATPVLGS
jgi:hypothetical protein